MCVTGWGCKPLAALVSHSWPTGRSWCATCSAVERLIPHHHQDRRLLKSLRDIHPTHPPTQVQLAAKTCTVPELAVSSGRPAGRAVLREHPAWHKPGGSRGWQGSRGAQHGWTGREEATTPSLNCHARMGPSKGQAKMDRELTRPRGPSRPLGVPVGSFPLPGTPWHGHAGSGSEKGFPFFEAAVYTTFSKAAHSPWCRFVLVFLTPGPPAPLTWGSSHHPDHCGLAQSGGFLPVWG